MVKRRATAESDNEDASGGSTPVSKRARVDDDDIVEIESPQKKKSNGKGKGKGKAEDDEEDDGTDDEKFEQDHTEKVRASIESRSKTQGGIADFGIIETVEMHQFMCHKFLTFTFGPQINFIIGHNGSGKSAVLTAITVALGGKAATTGRGNGLKSFIREGQSVSEVSISIKNQGEEAYKPKEYGKSIVITRRFTKDGGSTWKIKSKDGKIISTKREELAAICDHMNIQVDNPMNVLTQDSARQFLSASTPGDKYKFFLKGTQLAQLSDEYELCLSNIQQTTQVLTKKREALPDLVVAAKEASHRFDEAQKAREQSHKADALKQELAWAHVASKQAEMQSKFEEVAKAERRIPKVQANLDAAEAKFKEATEEVGRQEEEYQNLGSIAELEDERKVLADKMSANKTKIADLKREEKEMNTSINNLNLGIEEVKRNIEEEERKLAEDTSEKRERTLAKLKAAQEAFKTAEAEHGVLRDELSAARDKVETAKREGQQAGDVVAERKRALEENKQGLDNVRAAANNALGVYGQGMPRALDAIARAKWHGRKPVGPFGQYVKVRDPKWSKILRTTIGGHMFGFGITDPRDRAGLKRILDENRCDANIIISGYDMFDYSHGEPSGDMLTVLRALEINDPYVLRVLINSSKIERLFLFDTRAEAQEVLTRQHGGGVAYTLDGFNHRDYGDGGKQSQPLQGMRGGDRKAQLFPERDSAGQLQFLEQTRVELEEQYNQANAAVQQCRDKYNWVVQEYQKLQAKDKEMMRRLPHLKLQRDQLQDEANEELPTGAAAYHLALNEVEADKASLLAQFRALTAQRMELDDAQKPLLRQLNDVRARIRDFQDQQSTIRVRIEEVAAARLQAMSDRTHTQTKLAEEQGKVDRVKAESAIIETEYQEWRAKALEYCAEWANPRRADDVKRELAAVQQSLKERERRHGASVEDLVIEVNKTQAALRAVEKDLQTMSTLNTRLRASVQLRLVKWHEFRRHIALRTKLIFQFHLAQRGFYGKVLFDHHAESLKLKVQTEDNGGTQSKEKDPNSLSGGEKSFSTICLLLALWEAIGCPIRCLDEFDVFMDAVNRRISMKMMIDTAKASDKKQYILITPQDMTNVHGVGTTVRVHRMTDPERGQGVLAFNGGTGA